MDESLAKWLNAHRRRGLRFLVDVFGMNVQDAEDVFGQVVLRWLKKPPEFVTVRYFLKGCYLAGSDFLRSEGRCPEMAEYDALPEDAQPGKHFHESTLTDEQEREIASLDDLTRRAATLVSQGYTREEAAEILNVPPSTVRRWFCMVRREILKKCA